MRKIIIILLVSIFTFGFTPNDTNNDYEHKKVESQEVINNAPMKVDCTVKAKSY